MGRINALELLFLLEKYLVYQSINGQTMRASANCWLQAFNVSSWIEAMCLRRRVCSSLRRLLELAHLLPAIHVWKERCDPLLQALLHLFLRYLNCMFLLTEMHFVPCKWHGLYHADSIQAASSCASSDCLCPGRPQFKTSRGKH